MCRTPRSRIPLLFGAAVVLVTLLIALAAGPALASTTESFQTTRVTTNSVQDHSPQVSGNRIVWMAVPADGTDSEIYTWTASGGLKRVTDNDLIDSAPQVSGDKIVWMSSTGSLSSEEIWTWTPSGGQYQITDNSLADMNPQVSGDRVVWSGVPGGPIGHEIYTWTPGGGLLRVTSNDFADDYPSVSDGQIVWQAQSGGDWEIYHWTQAGGVSPLTANAWSDTFPKISGERVVWQAIPDGSDYEVYTFSPTEGVKRLTDNDYNELNPRTAQDRVVWQGYPDPGLDGEIYTWTLAGGTQRLTDDSSDDVGPMVSGDRIVWSAAAPAAAFEVYTWTPWFKTIRMTNNAYSDSQVAVSGDRVAWIGEIITDANEIYTAVANPAVGALTPTYGPASGGTTVRVLGSGFTGATAVKFGGTAATAFTVISPNEIHAVSPAHGYGAVGVMVTTPLGTSSAAGTNDDFTFYNWFQQDSSRLFYSGTWSTVSAPPASGGSFKVANSPSTSVRIPFTGSYLRILARTGPNCGRMSFSVDGGAVGIVELYSNTERWRVPVFSSSFGSGFHVLELSYTGSKDGASSGYSVNIDAILVLGEVSTLKRYEESDTRLKFSSAWSVFDAAGASDGHYKRANTSGSYVIIPFYGLRLDWIGTKGTTLGKALVSVDGGATTTVNLAADPVAYQKMVFTTGTLGLGYHTVKISWDPSNAADKYISLDAVDVIGELTASAWSEETSSALLWTGSWMYPNIEYASGGRYAKTDTAGAKVAFYLYGTRLDIIGTKAPAYGKLKITIDGTPNYADLYDQSIKWKQQIWSSGFIKPGYHYVVLEWTGAKNGSSGGTAVAFDALRYWGRIMKYVVL